MNCMLLNDWMTMPGINMGAKITSTDEDEVYHSHDFYEIFYILEGNIEHIVNERSQTLETGDIVFLRLNDKHMFKRKNGQICRHRDIIVNKQQFESTCRYIDQSLLEEYSKRAEPLKAHLPFEKIQYFEKKINTLINLSLQKECLNKSVLINILIVELLDIYIQAKIETQNLFPSWFENLLSRFYMSEFMKEGLNKIMEDLNYDKSYICRTFKKLTGITMSQFLCETRLNYAANLIQSTDYSILQICNTVGFSSISYFNEQFKNKFKSTPTAFRSQYKLTQ